ncbi:hypothetical protein H0H93_009591 [Arthromyces matolae]|nr:hypothetical protein H0H93_009591 [Arthromyces matolae]
MRKLRSSGRGDDLVKTIRDAATLLSQLTSLDEKTARQVFPTIAQFKFFVSTWQSDKMHAVEGINAWEAAAVAKRLPRDENWYKEPEEVKDLLKNAPQGTTMEQANHLEQLVMYTGYLTLKEQAGINKELHEGYDEVAKKVALWPKLDYWREEAEGYLKKWEGLISMVG